MMVKDRSYQQDRRTYSGEVGTTLPKIPELRGRAMKINRTSPQSIWRSARVGSYLKLLHKKADPGTKHCIRPHERNFDLCAPDDRKLFRCAGKQVLATLSVVIFQKKTGNADVKPELYDIRSLFHAL